LERDKVFRKTWLNVGRVEQIPCHGDYFVKEIAVCQTSVIVARGQGDNDGQLHAFHNMCSHRGNKVVWDQHGTAQNFTSKFHGWTYGRDGQLKFVPDEDNFFGLQKECLGLTSVAVDVWAGFIFIHLDPSPQETLNDYLGQFGHDVGGYPFADRAATCWTWTTTFHMWPVSVDQTFWEVHLYAPQAQRWAQRFSQEYGKVLFRDAIMEDASTFEATQSVLGSGAKQKIILQDEEILIRHSHKVMQEHVGAYSRRNAEAFSPFNPRQMV
jgi:nitrite reductase/ring-hydroxylating ferredoxin subunit